MIVAFVYRGAGDKEPRSHVDRIPPEFVIMKPMATAVARRTCGAVLFAFQAESGGARPYAPVREKKMETYLTDLEVVPGGQCHCDPDVVRRE